MPFFMKDVIEKILVTKTPFWGVFLLGSLPILFPQTENWPLVYDIFYWILYFWLWSWLLASWMSFSFATSEQITPPFYSRVVGRTWLLQVKLTLLSLLTTMVIYFPSILLLYKPLLLVLATPDEITAMQSALAGRGELNEQGLFLFTQLLLITLAIPFYISFIFYIRCGLGMLAIVQGSNAIGLVASWKKSKGTTLLAVKFISPFFFALALVVYLSVLAINSGVMLNFIIGAVATIVLIPMFLEGLISYYRQLQSNSEG